MTALFTIRLECDWPACSARLDKEYVGPVKATTMVYVARNNRWGITHRPEDGGTGTRTVYGARCPEHRFKTVPA